MRSLPLWAAAALLGACATSGPIPKDEMVAAGSTIKSAEAAGATRYSDAKEHLELAQQGYSYATKLLEEGDNRRAAYVLERAQSDAELAWAVAQEIPLRQQAEALMKKTSEQQQQLQAPPPPPPGSGEQPGGAR